MNQLLSRHKWFQRGFIVLLSFICVLSFAKIISLKQSDVFYGGLYFGYNISSVALFALAIYCLNRYLQREKRRLKVFSSIGGVLLGLAIVYGAYAHIVNDIFISWEESMLQIGCVLGVSVLTTPLMSELFLGIEKAGAWFNEQAKREDELTAKQKGKFFLLSWIGIFIAFLPLFLNCWPGNFIFDAKYQMANVITGDHFTHHPLAHTLLMGAMYKLGQSLGDVSVGYQFYTLIQMLVLSSSFAYTSLYIYTKSRRKRIWISALLWFALFPLHTMFSITATKDVLFAAFFLYFMVFVIRYYVDREKFCWYSYVGMTASVVFALLYRNNMKQVLLLVAVFTILFFKGKSQKLVSLGVFVVAYLLSGIINTGLVHYANAAVDTDTYRESMSVPLQCLARVACYRGHELDQALYDEIYQYIPAQDIANYSPYLSDAVKNNANEELLKNNLANFFKLFIKVGLQYPDEYLESILTNTMGYWYPLNQGYYVSVDISTHHTLIGIGDEIEKKDFWPGGKLFDYLYWKGYYRNVPVLGYLCRNVIYVWMYVIFMLWCLLYKRKDCLMPGLWGLVYLLTCFAGPVAALRYIYCLVVTLPLIVCLFLFHGGQKAERDGLEEKCI